MARSTTAPSLRSGSTRPSPPRLRDTRRPGRTIDHHGPVRSCIGCRRRRLARELVRITRVVDDQPSVEIDGASRGRGAWLCRDEPACLDAAVRTRQFARAWRTTIDDDDVAAIRRAIQEQCDTPAELRTG
ncbi:MAG: YlxR family protein [Ilumatobacter sp.]